MSARLGITGIRDHGMPMLLSIWGVNNASRFFTQTLSAPEQINPFLHLLPFRLLLLQLPDQSLTHLQQGLLNSSEASPLSIDTALGAAASGLSSITTWAGSQDGQGFLWMLAAAQAMAVGTVMVRAGREGGVASASDAAVGT
jgi:hypothetical protein